jgi:hypothetical protein
VQSLVAVTIRKTISDPLLSLHGPTLSAVNASEHS